MEENTKEKLKEREREGKVVVRWEWSIRGEWDNNGNLQREKSILLLKGDNRVSDWGEETGRDILRSNLDRQTESIFSWF